MHGKVKTVSRGAAPKSQSGSRLRGSSGTGENQSQGKAGPTSSHSPLVWILMSALVEPDASKLVSCAPGTNKTFKLSRF